MKWYNEDRTKMIDLDKISGYVYIPAKDYVKKYPTEADVDDFKENGDKLELIIGGSVFMFRGDVAKEIFDLIEGNTRQII